MSERKYSVAEIDRMREAVGRVVYAEDRLAYDEKREAVERRLRTYMQNGTDPEELERESEKRASGLEAERDLWNEEERISHAQQRADRFVEYAVRVAGQRTQA